MYQVATFRFNKKVLKHHPLKVKVFIEVNVDVQSLKDQGQTSFFFLSQLFSIQYGAVYLPYLQAVGHTTFIQSFLTIQSDYLFSNFYETGTYIF